jgi:hypothetical protein
MDPNLVNAVLSADDQQVILAALNTVLQKLPFLLDLTTEQRVTIPKLGDKTEAFVRKAVEIAVQNPNMFATAFLDEMQKDANLLDALAPIRVAIDALHKKIDDTTMQVGAEAFAAARTVYTVTKSPFGNAVFREASADLGQRYGRSKKAKAAPAPGPKESGTPAGQAASEPTAATPKS